MLRRAASRRVPRRRRLRSATSRDRRRLARRRRRLRYVVLPQRLQLASTSSAAAASATRRLGVVVSRLRAQRPPQVPRICKLASPSRLWMKRNEAGTVCVWVGILLVAIRRSGAPARRARQPTSSGHTGLRRNFYTRKSCPKQREAGQGQELANGCVLQAGATSWQQVNDVGVILWQS